LAFQSLKVCSLAGNIPVFFLQVVLWLVDSFAAVYIVQFTETHTLVFWLWFTTNTLQTIFFEPIQKRSLHIYISLYVVLQF
jgi:hypothetical protein